MTIKLFNKGDRAILNYVKDGSNQSIIVQILKIMDDTYIVCAPLKLLKDIGIELLDQKEFEEINEGWGIIMVKNLEPCKKPEFKIILGEK